MTVISQCKLKRRLEPENRASIVRCLKHGRKLEKRHDTKIKKLMGISISELGPQQRFYTCLFNSFTNCDSRIVRRYNTNYAHVLREGAE